MQQQIARRQVTAPAVLGVVLIAIGIAAMLFRQAGVNLFESIGSWGWPFFIIVPGVVLLALSLIPTPPKGIGFATGGAIVTTVGSILLYQQRTGHWESWAYVWALIPLAAGLALILYGLVARERRMVTNGVWMAGIATLLFLVGAWFFEGVFAGNSEIIDAGNWWPVAVIILGVVIAFRAVLVPPARQPTSGPPNDQVPDGSPQG